MVGSKPITRGTGYYGWQSHQNHLRVGSKGELLLPEEKQKECCKAKTTHFQCLHSSKELAVAKGVEILGINSGNVRRAIEV